jgi:hypothetical protein
MFQLGTTGNEMNESVTQKFGYLFSNSVSQSLSNSVNYLVDEAVTGSEGVNLLCNLGALITNSWLCSK